MATPSKMSNKAACYICGREYMLERHHCLHGSNRRTKAEEDGLWVWLCRDCHDQVHFGNKMDAAGNDGAAMDLFLQKEAEREYLKEHDLTDFIERYGKNYL